MNDNNEIMNETKTGEESTNVFKKCLNTAKGLFKKCSAFVKDAWTKSVKWFKEKTKDVKWKDVWDKFTTGLLILLMCSPLLILGYIFLWFVLKA